MMKVNIYILGNRKNNYTPQFITSVNVKLKYEGSFYFRDMPTISARICRKIIRQVNDNNLRDSVSLLFENVKTGYRGIQKLYKNGTIVNF